MQKALQKVQPKRQPQKNKLERLALKKGSISEPFFVGEAKVARDVKGGLQSVGTGILAIFGAKRRAEQS